MDDIPYFQGGLPTKLIRETNPWYRQIFSLREKNPLHEYTGTQKLKQESYQVSRSQYNLAKKKYSEETEES